MDEIERSRSMDEWKLPWEGGCRCGEVRLRVTKPPLLAGACHCTGCQKMSASAFSLSLTLPGDALEVTAGEPAIGGTHHPVQHHWHCPRCKSWMFTRVEGFEWFVNLRATMLDDHAWVAPFVELWTREKLAWAQTGAARGFETAPEAAAWPELMQAYAAEGARP
jgi:hypothetical protein